MSQKQIKIVSILLYQRPSPPLLNQKRARCHAIPRSLHDGNLHSVIYLKEVCKGCDNGSDVVVPRKPRHYLSLRCHRHGHLDFHWGKSLEHFVCHHLHRVKGHVVVLEKVGSELEYVMLLALSDNQL